MDSIISAVITPIVDVILKPLVRELGYLFKLGENMRKLEKKSRELNLIKDEVHEKIMHAEAESDEMMPTKQATEWMWEVQTLKEDVIAKIEEKFDQQKTRLLINCWPSYIISRRAAKAILEAEELIRKQQQFEGLTVRSAPIIRRMLTQPEVTHLSTEKYLKEVIDYIQDDEVGMVGIWGMGGVGKTTLLRKINNHPSIANAGFEYVIWLVASQDLNIDRLRKDIADRVGFNPDAARLQAQTLYHYLEVKKFLLLLDDIWEPFDLTMVGIPYPRPGDDVLNKHKIVFTTRSESVCNRMMARSQLVHMRCKKIKIDCLQPEEAWKLFLSNVGEGMRSLIISDQRVGRRAKIIADKCGGLPLALVVIAQTMSANTTWQEWENAVNLINTNRIQEMWVDGADPFPLLKISYDRLQDDITRKCFLCCALWPEDHEIPVHELIECWLGMNIIDYCGDIGATYMRGYIIIESLKRACLLEQVYCFHVNKVKMHDIIRGMALWIVSSNQREWMVCSRANLKDESEDATQWREAETISLSYGRSGILPQHPNCPKLLSLILSWNHIELIPRGFFQNMPALTFLDLSWGLIEEVPPAIGGLLQLRHLDLSFNPIRSLPVELENLARLKVLLLNGLSGLIFPKLSKFHMLGHLGVYYLDLEVQIDKDEQALVKEVVNSKIRSIDFRVTRHETLDQLVKNPSVSFRFLAITNLVGATTLPLTSLLRMGKTSSTLSVLHIVKCDDLEDISISKQHEEQYFDNLEYFVLRTLPNLKNITLSGVFRNVRFLQIWSCPKLKSVTWVLHCPYVETLIIDGCDEMEHVIGNEEDGSSGDEVGEAQGQIEQEGNPMEFLHLRFLELQDLPVLRIFSTRAIAFPSLKHISIGKCPLLDVKPPSLI